MPAITIEAAPRYLVGFPIVVAVTYDNRSKDTEFYDLPELGLLATQATLRARLDPPDGGAPANPREHWHDGPWGGERYRRGISHVSRIRQCGSLPQGPC